MANIIEALQNAKLNLTVNFRNEFARTIGTVQINNVIKMLELGYPPYFDIEETLEEYGVDSVDKLPEYFSKDEESS